MHNSMQTNDPSAQILQKRKIRDGTDVSAWRTPCVKEFYQNHCQLMVAERRRVDRLNLRISTPEGVPPPSYRNAGGTNEFATKKLLF